MQIRGGLVFFCLALLVSGCTSGPELNEYPMREIDRPYTLPHGVAAWSMGLGVGSYKNLTGEDPSIFSGNMSWQTAPSDRWNLVWSPLPLDFKYQIFKDDTQILGFGVGVGVGYSSVSGWLFEPHTDVTHRILIAQDLAFLSRAFYQVRTPGQNSASTWRALVSVGPQWQINPASSLWFNVGYSNSYQPRYTLIELPPDADYTTLAQRSSFPIGISYIFTLNRQWDLNASYTLDMIGARSEDVRDNANVGFVHYW